MLEAAAQVFDREGLSATTNRIAEKAGVSIGSIYQYFPNKQALLYALAQRHVKKAVERLDAVFDQLRVQEPPFEDTMRTILDTLVALHSDRPGLHGLMHRVVPARAAELVALQRFEDHLTHEVAFHLRRCGVGGRVGDDESALATAQVLVHTVDAQLHRVMPRRGMDTEPLLELVLRLLGD
ncbi:TetR/AcrR family transcriptional regulator [Mycobacterium sp. CBMA247]|nr:TetR/AcrR family transcriptional regulator [Mycolicibacterium sp. CBMA 329]MUL89459.1 TetR/AcrR family transcriptional regulator [Mycolicibacterium sp. CBMA 331]MUL99148.1 TetR/AcrR family transcriptional regulator [Mycolicibacterium sp. CBMA 334]MUM25709.1 TetR/AcrR family transcriptional regulator [Mycolicibacterium sp. CBMA 295]MUM38975.1 TetR/AcrR family transcriptional regulator [Mycolicibacterium sp. CBMA 247]MUM45523.1 TetR/AcrR family transcriptional regulator [Mycolicibacterium sp.